MTRDPRPAWLCMDGWSGRSQTPVEIIGETPKRFRIKLLRKTRLPGRFRFGNVGDVILVPRTAIILTRGA